MSVQGTSRSSRRAGKAPGTFTTPSERSIRSSEQARRAGIRPKNEYLPTQVAANGPPHTGLMTKLGEHAVVLGASMGGLLAARVLADFYDTVTVVERDELPETAANRRGVPQSRHGHLLLSRGSQVLGELFPGLLDELVAAGAPVLGGDDDLSKMYLSNGGHLFPRSGRFNDVEFFLPSRRLLE